MLLFILVVVLLRDHRPLQRFTYTIGLVGIVLLLLPLVPGLGTEKFGARIWIEVGGYSFQPAEAAKILLAIAFAGYLVEKRDVLALAGYRLLGLDLPRARDLGPIAVIWLLSLAILVLQRDLGTSLLFFGLFVMLLYVSTERPGWVVLGTLLFAAGAYFGYLTFHHVKVRVGAWLDPFSDYDAYFQVINAQFGMAWGGLLGTGLGLGRPGLTPLARSDFIAAAIGEELGMTGLMAVIMIYGLIVARGLRTALQCREPFGKLLAAGLSFAFALQVFTILGGVTRLLPLTGLTTPFMSQGGSSLVSNWVVMALLLVISHQVRKPAVTVTPLDPDAQTTQLMKVRHDRERRIAIRHAARESHAVGGATERAAAFHARWDRPVREASREQADPAGRVRGDDHVRAAAGQRDVHDDRAAELAGRGAAEPPGTRRRVRPEPRRDPGRGQDQDRHHRADGRRVQVPAGLPRGRAVRTDHRVLLLRPLPDRAGDQLQLPAGRHRRRAVRPAADRPGDQPHAAGRQRADHDRAQGAARGGEALGDQKGAVVALDPQHRGRAGHGHQPELRPERDRQPRHRGRRQGVQPAGERLDPPAGQPGGPGDLPARVDLQAGHGRGRAGRRQDRGQQGEVARPAEAPGHQHLPAATPAPAAGPR